MTRSIHFLVFLFILLGVFESTKAQYHPLIALNNITGINNNYTPSKPLLKNEDEVFLETLFAPDTIPPLNIKVLENALGDVVHDSVLNILDLLRLRDIVIGRQPTPTTYELTEGDLSHNGIITSEDLNILRDILLRKSSVPYLIGPSGGEVQGDRIILTIPPNAVDSTIIISVKRKTESEFASEFGVDTKSALQDSAYFMTSFEITSSRPNFKLPVNSTIKLDSVPPCAYQGLNGTFAAVPDRDGDGRAELFMINELQLNGDSLTLTTADLPVPTIQMLSTSSMEPGQLLIIRGSGFGDDPQSVVVRFVSIAAPESVTVVPPNFIVNDTIIVIVPGDLLGHLKVEVSSLQTGIVSNTLPLTIFPSSLFVGDIRSIIVGFFQGMITALDSTHLDKWFLSIEDTTVRNFLLMECQDNRSSLTQAINYFNMLPDSLLPEYGPIASFITNQSMASTQLIQLKEALRISSSIRGDCKNKINAEYETVENNLRKLFDSRKRLYEFFVRKCFLEKSHGQCTDCEVADGWREDVLKTTDLLADLWNMIGDRICRECPGEIECDKCKKTVSVGFGPKGQVTASFDENGMWKTTNCCTNIKKYKRNECIGVLRPVTSSHNSPVPLKKPEFLNCPTNTPLSVMSSNQNASQYEFAPHAGSIIKITNAPVSYNMVGILNDNGKAFIPSVPFNTKVTFSIYDPVSGLYDPDAGTYTTGSEPGGFDRPMLLFQPNTQIRNYIIKVGEPVHDSVSINMQAIYYLLRIEAKDTSKLINISFEASTLLSLRIEDPDANVIFTNLNVACYSIRNLRFNIIGTYRIRVAYGVSALPGSFDLGMSYLPSPPVPTSCLCSDVLMDTLSWELSPYEVRCTANILTNDSLIIEPGVTLQFKSGGIINAVGTLQGFGTPTKPIKLKQASTVMGEIVKIEKPVAQRKEVQP